MEGRGVPNDSDTYDLGERGGAKAWSLIGWLGGGPYSPVRAEIVGGVGKRSVVVEQARRRGGRRRAREEDVTACRSAVLAPRPPWVSAAASCAAGCSARPSRRRSTSERKRQREK
jgi:hypothetical protein